MAEEIISGTALIFLYSSQACQNNMFSSLYSDFRNSRKAICPAGDTGVSATRRAGARGIRIRVSPLQPRTLSTDSAHVSTSSRGSLGKQQNLPLKRASRSITSHGAHRQHHTTWPKCHVQFSSGVPSRKRCNLQRGKTSPALSTWLPVK